MARIFGRICKVTVDGRAVEELRVGFTIEKDLTPEINRCECSVYNLSEDSRNAYHKGQGIPVVIEAGYKDTGLTLVFAGEMREAYSRPVDGGHTWITTLRAGDGDKGGKKKRKGGKTSGIRPGVSLERVISDLSQQMGVGIGNVGAALKQGDFSFEGLGKQFAKGFNTDGKEYDSLQKMLRATGHELSIQDGELQALKRGQALSLTATVLNLDSGLESSPEIDAKGEVSFRCRILPGIAPGYPVQVESVTSYGSGIWRIEKTRIIGDTRDQDWSIECKAREIK